MGANSPPPFFLFPTRVGFVTDSTPQKMKKNFNPLLASICRVLFLHATSAVYTLRVITKLFSKRGVVLKSRLASRESATNVHKKFIWA